MFQTFEARSDEGPPLRGTPSDASTRPWPHRVAIAVGAAIRKDTTQPVARALANPFANDTPRSFFIRSDQGFLWRRRGEYNPKYTRPWSVELAAA